MIKNILVNNDTWKEIILTIFESTLLVDIGQLGDIFFPFTEVTFLSKALFSYIVSTSKDPRGFTTLTFFLSLFINDKQHSGD